MRKWKPWKHDDESVHAKPLYKTQMQIDNLKIQNQELLSIAGELAFQLKIATDPFFQYEDIKSEGCAPCDALARYSSFLDSLS